MCVVVRQGIGEGKVCAWGAGVAFAWCLSWCGRCGRCGRCVHVRVHLVLCVSLAYLLSPAVQGRVGELSEVGAGELRRLGQRFAQWQQAWLSAPQSPSLEFQATYKRRTQQSRDAFIGGCLYSVF